MDRQVRKLRSKETVTVKVVQKNYPSEEATWEDEEVMRAKYSHLFTFGGSYMFKIWGPNFFKGERM